MKNAALSSLLKSVLLSSVFSGLIFGFSPSPAHADQIDQSGRNWLQEIRAAIQQDKVRLEILDLKTNIVPLKTRERLAEISYDQAQIWGDTILEGDYSAEVTVTLDKVEAVFVEDTFAGYRVTYSSVAFDTFGCEISKCQCPAGRIVESSYVSPELGNWTRDTEAYAEFVPDGT